MTLNTLRLHPYSPVGNMPMLALTVAVIAVLSWCGQQLDPHIADENHLLEWGQALFLLLACAAHGRRAWTAPRATVSFALHLGLALLMYAFLLRELEIDQFGDHRIWIWIERFFRAIEGGLWLAYIIYMVPRVKALWSHRAVIFALPVMGLTLVGGLFLVAGWPFDKAVFHALSHGFNELAEEVLELNGCMILFCAALADSAPALLINSAVARGARPSPAL